MTPHNLPIRHYRRDSFSRHVSILECAGSVETPRSLVGAVVTMQVRHKRGTQELLVEMSTSNGRVVFPQGAASGAFTITLNPADSTALRADFEMVYDIQIVETSGFTYTICTGDFIVQNDVSQ